MNLTFDAIIIGAGQAGPSLAGRLTAAGQTVALIEREHLGGTCVNTGYMPTKTMVAIHGIIDMMHAKAPYTTIQRAVHLHPTVSELIPTMLAELKPL